MSFITLTECGGNKVCVNHEHIKMLVPWEEKGTKVYIVGEPYILVKETIAEILSMIGISNWLSTT